MPYSVEALYTGDGATTQFGIEFEYQEEAHVHVTVNGAVVPFSFFAPSTILIIPAPALGAAVRIWRETPVDALNHEFQLGAPFLPAYIDSNNTQLLFATQESQDASRRASEAAASVEATAQEALDTANEAMAAVEAAGVAAFNGRAGLVVSEAGDYTADMIPRGASDVDQDLTAVETAVGVLETGKQDSSAVLDILATLVPGGDKLPYFTGPATADVTDLTAFARSLLALATAEAVRAAIGAVASNSKQLATAWVRFNPVQLNATYVQVGTTITVTFAVAHGMTPGMKVGLFFTSGTAVNGSFIIQTTPTTDTLTVTASAPLSTSGGVTKQWVILDSYNVASVSRSAAGRYNVLFETPMDHAGYAIACPSSGSVNGSYPIFAVNYNGSASVTPTVNGFTIWTTNSTGGVDDFPYVQAIVFGGKN